MTKSYLPGVELPFKELLILCVGSPFSGDNIALRLGELLQQRQRQAQLPGWIRIAVYDRPGMSMLWEFERAESMVIVDALVSHDEAGKLIQLSTAELMSDQIQISSHECGVAQVLEMASMLGQLPQSFAVFGISVGDAADWVPGLEQLQHLADTLMDEVIAWIQSTVNLPEFT